MNAKVEGVLKYMKLTEEDYSVSVFFLTAYSAQFTMTGPIKISGIFCFFYLEGCLSLKNRNDARILLGDHKNFFYCCEH